MQLPPLTRGRILRRYKRFLTDVELMDGMVVTAHCPNTGSMRSCWEPGAPVELSFSRDPKRKLPWTLERVDMGAGWVGVNTGRTNAVVAETVTAGRIKALAGYRDLRREVRLEAPDQPRARLDLMLSGGATPDALVEVKNVTLLDGDRLRFPDAVSVRALKHLNHLQSAVERGLRGVVLFACNRPEGDCFSPAWDIDPGYARRLREVVDAGVEALALRIQHSVDGMSGVGIIPIVLDGERNASSS